MNKNDRKFPMTNQELLAIAMAQSAREMNCHEKDFIREEPIVVTSCKSKGARAYYSGLPFDCNLVSYGTNVVASARPDLKDMVEEYLNRYPAEHCFETPHMHVLNQELQTHGLQICFMAEYFLPDLDQLDSLPCKYPLRLLEPKDFALLYQPQWSNALCEKRKSLDVMGVGAYDGDELVGLAGASADCDTMWQIGIDVLPAYRRKGIASALTARLALEVLNQGRAPFYCAAWANIKSVRNAVKSGFRPAWVEMTAKSAAFVAKMNQI